MEKKVYRNLDFHAILSQLTRCVHIEHGVRRKGKVLLFRMKFNISTSTCKLERNFGYERDGDEDMHTRMPLLSLRKMHLKVILD